MRKLFRLIGTIEETTLDKLILLERIVRLYVRFDKFWKTAGVLSNGTTEFSIRFMTIDKYGYETFTEHVYPLENLDRRIRSYKRRLGREFRKRHDNPRIQRQKEIYKWQRYIQENKKDA